MKFAEFCKAYIIYQKGISNQYPFEFKFEDVYDGSQPIAEYMETKINGITIITYTNYPYLEKPNYEKALWFNAAITYVSATEK